MISVEDLNATSSNDDTVLLDISSLMDGQVINCIAYVQSCYVKTSRIGKPFATFVLKDKNANVIVARLFDIGDSAKYTQVFMHRPVKLRAGVQIYGGSFSLVIDGEIGISVYNDDFDYASFIGKYTVDLTTAATIYEKYMGGVLPAEAYQNLSVDFLGSGKVGAFAKIFDMALFRLISLEDINGVNMKQLLQVYFTAMQQYYLILSRYGTFGTLERLKLIDEYNSVVCSEDIRYIVIDVLKSVCENAKPLHLYAHLIKDSLRSVSMELQLIDTSTTMVPGASVQVYFTDLLGNSLSGGVELLKY